MRVIPLVESQKRVQSMPRLTRPVMEALGGATINETLHVGFSFNVSHVFFFKWKSKITGNLIQVSPSPDLLYLHTFIWYSSYMHCTCLCSALTTSNGTSWYLMGTAAVQ